MGGQRLIHPIHTYLHRTISHRSELLQYITLTHLSLRVLRDIPRKLRSVCVSIVICACIQEANARSALNASYQDIYSIISRRTELFTATYPIDSPAPVSGDRGLRIDCHRCYANWRLAHSVIGRAGVRIARRWKQEAGCMGIKLRSHLLNREFKNASASILPVPCD